MFSILIPTWNNYACVKLCYESIRKHSHFNHQVILHINESSDETLSWAQKENIPHTFSAENIGICKAMNLAYSKATQSYICYMNDDMYCCPDWDVPLANEISKIGHNSFMLSATMIEHRDTDNKAVLVGNYGDSPQHFNEAKLLLDVKSFLKPDWSGSSWPPNIVHRNMWDKIGGFSDSFSPGMSSDDDFCMKMWAAGCRYFKGIGNSFVYHFMARSTGRIVKNDGRKQFLEKWGMKQSTFNKYYLKKGEPFTGPLQVPRSLAFKLKAFTDKVFAK